MAAKIPVNVRIGVFLADVPPERAYNETRVTITETGSGTIHSASINAGEEPVPDVAGNLSYVTGFPAVQSGVPLHIDVRCLDQDEVLIGTPATHEATLDEVPDGPGPGTYYAPQSIYILPA